MRIENETGKGLTIGHTQLVVSLAMQAAYLNNLIVVHDDIVTIKRNGADNGFEVEFEAAAKGASLKSRVRAVEVFDAEVLAVIEVQRKANIPDLLETMQGIIDDARAAMLEAQSNIEALEVPQAQLGELQSELADGFRSAADAMDDLESLIEGIEY